MTRLLATLVALGAIFIAQPASAATYGCPPVSFAPVAERAIVSVESGGNPLAIGDNDAHRSYFPRTLPAAIAKANELLSMGHNIDMGIAQINSIHLRGFGVHPRDLFDPCVNINISQHILYGNYRRAVHEFGEGQLALYHAISAYNTGSLWRGEGYVRKVVAAAGIAPALRSTYTIASAPARWAGAQSTITARGHSASKVRMKKPRSIARATITYTPEDSPMMLRVTQTSSGSRVSEEVKP